MHVGMEEQQLPRRMAEILNIAAFAAPEPRLDLEVTAPVRRLQQVGFLLSLAANCPGCA